MAVGMAHHLAMTVGMPQSLSRYSGNTAIATDLLLKCPITGSTLVSGSPSERGRLFLSPQLSSKAFPADPNGFYAVFTAPDAYFSGYCTSYCGWHTMTYYTGVPIKYSFLGHPATVRSRGQSHRRTGEWGARERCEGAPGRTACMSPFPRECCHKRMCLCSVLSAS